MKQEDALAWAVEKTEMWHNKKCWDKNSWLTAEEIALKAITLYLQKMQEE